jgi:hypothetical protein
MDKPLTPPSESGLVESHLDEDQAIDLLLGLLPEQAFAAAGRHLSWCKQCEDLVRRRGALLERRRASTGAAAVIESAAVPERSADPDRPRRAEGIHQWLAGTFRRPTYAFGLGCAILAAVVLLVLTGNPRRTVSFPTVAEWLPSARETLSLRKNADQALSGDLTVGLEAYDRRDLQAAISALSSAKTAGMMDVMRRVYLGSSLAQAGEYPRAATVLRSCPLTKIPQPWRDESYWTLLVALHGAGNGTAADSLLRALAAETSVIGGRARRLLGHPGP